MARQPIGDGASRAELSRLIHQRARDAAVSRQIFIESLGRQRNAERAEHVRIEAHLPIAAWMHHLNDAHTAWITSCLR